MDLPKGLTPNPERITLFSQNRIHVVFWGLDSNAVSYNVIFCSYVSVELVEVTKVSCGVSLMCSIFLNARLNSLDLRL